ncbi:MAG: DUF6062 family protein [Clostridia bacterium]|nr:DUF6062 family protein [Clostridia bacterium]
MKEKIYTIPVNEAFDKDCECPLCHLKDEIEKTQIEYALGAAMMEPDNRVESNEKGFCKEHFSMLYAYQNRLGLALVLDTHLEEIRNKLSSLDNKAKALKNERDGLFCKNNVKMFSEELSSLLFNIDKSCVICDNINNTMERYYDVTVYLWEKETEFRKKFNDSKGFCLSHFNGLSRAAVRYLNRAKAGEFIADLCKKQKDELQRIQADIHKFTLKFDYKNKDMEWGTAKDAPIRTIEKIVGQISSDKPKE